jgi:hypothetical protein
MEPRYRIIYSGRLRDGFVRDNVVRALAAAFRRNDDWAAKLIDTRAGKALKSDLDAGDAERLRSLLDRLGLDVAVRPCAPRVAAPAPQPAPPVAAPTPPRPAAEVARNPFAELVLQPMSGGRCPACGEQRVHAGICEACGIVSEKFLAAKAAGGSAPPAQPAPTGTGPLHGSPKPAPSQVDANRQPAANAPYVRPRRPPAATGGFVGSFNRIRRAILVSVLLFILFGVFFLPKPDTGGIVRAPSATAEPRPPAGWQRPPTAPNGQPWPTVAAYVRGYQRLSTNGYGSVTVDNSRNDSDVFVKLYSLSGGQPRPARVFYIPAYGQFNAAGMAAGRYDVRYRDLTNGRLARSEAFTLEERHSDRGVEYQELTLTLYKVRDGNTRTYPLAEGQF